MKIVLVYDTIIRPDTTGIYFRKAFEQLGCEVIHHAPLRQVGPTNFDFLGYADLPTDADFILQVDDDIAYPGPVETHPSAYYCIDTHRLDCLMGGGSRVDKAHGFDFVFSAQKDGVEILKAHGIAAQWLPLAYDPEAFYPNPEREKDLDWCFIGSMSPERKALCESLAAIFPHGAFGMAHGAQMLNIYHRSRIILNLPVSNDINMRVFEAMGAGGLLVTRNTHNGEAELFNSMVLYEQPEELPDLLRGLLADEPRRAALAAEQQRQVFERHSYLVRTKEILERVHST
ncbi:TPA: hypothetical protein DDW35_06410 [Candidatus Sumerlaeota bacterium]|nr:hypothetical protein [Candidatus Sumerlaeota bacterium]